MLKQVISVICVMALVLGLASIFTTASAGSGYWTGDGADSNWSTALNWSNGVPGSGDYAEFPGSYAGAKTTVTIGTLNIASISFGGTQDWVINGTSIAMSGYISAGATSATINANISGAGVLEMYNSSGNASALLVLNGTNTYSGETKIWDDCILRTSATSLTDSNLYFANGVFESSGTFSKALGTGANQVKWTAGSGTLWYNGGFSAYGSDLTVNIGGASGSLTWDSTTHFVRSGNLLFGTEYSNAMVDWKNPINLNGVNRTIEVRDNPNSTADFTRMSGILSNGSLTKTGAGTLELKANNTYSGGTTITNGTLVAAHNSALGTGSVSVDDDGALNIASGITVNNTISSFAGRLTGAGKLSGALTVGDGAVVAPGNSPGPITTGATTWAGGGVYEWEINSVSGSAGNDPGWDLWYAEPLTITATSGDKFIIKLISLGLNNNPGLANGFDPTTDYEWIILDSIFVGGFDESKFEIDSSSFVGATGVFSLEERGGSSIYLLYEGLDAVPVAEPTSLGLLGLALLGLRKRRS